MMNRVAAGARIGSVRLGRTAGETGAPAWRGNPSVDKIVAGESLRVPQGSTSCNRFAPSA
jgi:hypothetical protein